MLHQMKLANEWFQKIKDGTKTIECRLYDEKRRILKTGDVIEFTNTENEKEKALAKITALHTFPSFSQLLDQFPIAFFGTEDKIQFLNVLKTFYSQEAEKKYGVAGIEIQLI